MTQRGSQPAVAPPLPDRTSVSRAIDEVARRDPTGHLVHLVLAMVYLFWLALATAPKDIAFAALLVFAGVRLRVTLPLYAPLLRDRLGWAILAWAAWHGLTALWSTDGAQGLDELRAFRFVATSCALWPVMNRLPWLIGAFLLGVLAQNGVQLVQFLQWFGLDPDHNASRLRGLLHPIQTATICTAAMCWHCSAVLHKRGVPRWVALAGMLVAGVGLIFTGSRGPWLVAALVVPAQLLVTAIRRPATRRPALALAMTGVVAALAIWPVAETIVSTRVNKTVRDFRRAENHRLNTDVGVRLASWQTAWDLFLTHPLAGIGAGGFRDAAAAGEYGDILPRSDHAHSMYLHVLACTGAIGGALMLAVIGLAILRAARDPSDHQYADGNLFVLLAWLAGASFDVYQLMGQLFGLFAFLATITIPFRPELSITNPFRRCRPHAPNSTSPSP